ncbi:MAG: oligoendopeptidase, partial [Chloroflexi bacterium]|nr:oligoendopeptidase [Chloroflexota bacterium]
MISGKYHPRWDLETIFQGGSGSPEFSRFLDDLEKGPGLLRSQIELLGTPETPTEMDCWHVTLEMRDQLEDRLSQARAFSGCLTSQNVDDVEAKLLGGRIQQLIADFQRAELLLKERIRVVPEPVWQRLLGDARFQPIAFQLQEAREEVAELLPPEQEALIVDLSVDGCRAWERLYYTVAGRIRIPWESDGGTELLSPGQAYNKFSHPDPEVRARHFENWTGAWARESEVLSAALNHLGGFRLAAYLHRGWDSVLARALKENRIEARTL